MADEGNTNDSNPMTDLVQGLMKDENRNGVPDIMENASAQTGGQGVFSKSNVYQKFIVQGKEYNSFEEMPEDVKALFKGKFVKFGVGGNPLSGFFDSNLNASAPQNPQIGQNNDSPVHYSNSFNTVSSTGTLNIPWKTIGVFAAGIAIGLLVYRFF